MTKSLISSNDIFGGIKKNYIIKGSGSINGVLAVNFKRVESDQIVDNLRRVINNASLIIAIELKTALDAALRSSVWPKPSGISDIYDTGRLLESGSVLVDETGLKIVYSAPYARLVHYGGYINPYGNESAAKVYLPARPWVDAVLNGGGPVSQFNLAERYKQLIEAGLR